MSRFLQFLDRRSGVLLLVLTLWLLGLETLYALHRPLNPDEFNGFWAVAQVGQRVPYADFEPYKPVLGYYLQLPLRHLGGDLWGSYVAIRLGMAYLAVATLFLGALWLRRLFRPAAVCLAYALVVVMTSLVEWAIEVRLDMLTALFGFVSLLFLLKRRVALAGTLAGLSFLISQKGTLYALAGGAGLIGCLVIQRDRRWLRDLLLFSACVVLPVCGYVAFWSCFAPFGKVIGPTFGQPTQLSALVRPMPEGLNFYWHYWIETLTRNPLFYLYVLWAIGLLLSRGLAQSPLETLLLCYGVTVGFVMLSIQQPWAYMFVLLVPTGFVLQTYLFSRELDNPDSLLRRPALISSYVVLGLLLPLARVPVVARDDAGPQRQTMELAAALLQPGERYFAGFQILPQDAHENALWNIDIFAARPIHTLPSARHQELLERLREEPIRFIVYTSVIDVGVPEVIQQHFFANFAPFWANVWIYAPQCRPTDSQIDLRFPGAYRIETETPCTVRIDGESYASGQTIELRWGRHTIATPVRLRLKLQPTGIDHLLKPAYREPICFFWPDMGPAPLHYRTGRWVKD